LYVVSSAAPTGPRGGRRWVEMPISAPMPNSPPSANWVEALTRTMALSTSRRNRSAVAASSVTIASGMMRAVAFDMVDRAGDAVHQPHREDRVEIFGAPILFRSPRHRLVERHHFGSPRSSQPAFSDGRGCRQHRLGAAIDQQRLGRAADRDPRILALSTIARAFSGSAAASI